jgi:dephospho-CoA kinase
VRVVGLTGGIGAGKSAVARMLAELGAQVIDADRLAREAVEPGSPGFTAIVERFGEAILDEHGGLDRRKLGALVFADEAARRELNAIVHPRVAALAMEKIAALAAQGAKLLVYDVPLFFENNLERMIPEVIVVSVSPETQRERITARDPLSSAEIEGRIRAQMPLEEKLKRATWVIDNEGTLEQTRAQVEALYRRLIKEGES